MCNTHNAAALADQSAGMTSEEEAFAGRMVQTINDAGLALMMSVGHRTGLFEAMKKGPATSAELATRAGLNERYVREWLGAVTSGDVVAFDPSERAYSLPAAHASLLGRDADKGNMAAMFQFIAVLGAVEGRIVDCFRNGGGVSYSEFDRFHEVMAEESNQTVLAVLEDAILPLVPGLATKLEAGIEVADIGCGQGRAINMLAQLYPASRFTGYDLCLDTIETARTEAAQLGLTNVEFQAVDATHLPGDARFDLIVTFDAVHDQAKPAAVLANIRRLLKPGGVYLMQDIDGHSDIACNKDRPLSAWIYTISCMHCMTVSLAQGGDGLGAAWGEQLALAMLADAGFADVETHRLPHDMVNVYYVCR